MLSRRFLLNYWGVLVLIGVPIMLVMAAVNWVMGW